MAKKTKNKLMYVNLGCGIQTQPSTENIDWINVDNFFFPNCDNFVQGDLRDIPLEKNSVDYIICDNVLEHIQMCDIPVVIHEMRRITKVGGRIVIIVPDFRSAVLQWMEIDHDKSFSPQIYQYLSEVIYGNQIHEGEFHKSAMSPGFLNYNLQMCGFRDYKMIMHTAFGDAPDYPGAASRGKKLRNAQIVCDIKKT